MNKNNEISLTNNGHCIRVQDSIVQKEYEKINQLMELCCEHDKINLKLELDYKIHLYSIAIKNEKSKPSIMKEFFYYVDERLVSYLGISCFDGRTGEITGMTHPDWREKGLFHRLLALAINECQYSKFSTLLLLSDGNSKSGMRFLEASQSEYSHSEYRMKRSNSRSAGEELSVEAVTINDYNAPIIVDTISAADLSIVTLRSACKADQEEITRQNIIYFNEKAVVGEDEEYKPIPLEDNPENYKTFMVELDGKTIGKVNIEFSDNSAFISGFGILPNYRGKGYGKAALKEALHIIETQSIPVTELDVVGTNSKALNLYKTCGFEEISTMNYYKYSY